MSLPFAKFLYIEFLSIILHIFFKVKRLQNFIPDFVCNLFYFSIYLL
mgnify:FL=1